MPKDIREIKEKFKTLYSTDKFGQVSADTIADFFINEFQKDIEGLEKKIKERKENRNNNASLMDDEWFKGKNKNEVFNQGLEVASKIIKVFKDQLK